MAENPKESMIDCGVTTIFQPVLAAPKVVTARPSAMPSRPPTRLIVTASIRNWLRMSARLAPIALRMPISRVRSVTVTSMIFMIPMPPTNSDTPATLASNMVKMPVCCWAVLRRSA